ncbi:hypothetical protein MRB53_014734 [Persea americana]|uniref:Uncharacterized protein n=1 Tax=Persea americana TaxID=3435 RepID=A0ACC2KBM7_PERAE|nr:hypothetical protein MRB53_014734 [Persea americana]
MPSSSGLLHSLSPSIINSPVKPKKFNHYSIGRKLQHNSLKCKASSVIDYDLYDLLGIDNSSNQSQIKNAYRSLQKRCHPDIAGPAGHDMAIILNEAYAVLSNPNLRYVYDKEQAKMAEFRGYTGKPLYSMWFGSETEQRAVFVDEIKCVGCLKCALFAEKTFAIESVYGRARVVAQWADPEHKIHDAIQSCPVDCISIVERSNLAALEFLMSKQPRGSVQMSAGNTVGTRVSNIFVDVNKFQSKFHQMKDMEASKGHSSKEPDLQRDVQASAVQAIRSISNWLYWQSPRRHTSQTHQKNLLCIPEKKTTGPNTGRLQEAAARRRERENTGQKASQNKMINRFYDEYWTPTLSLPPLTNQSNSMPSSSPPVQQKVVEEATNMVTNDEKWENPMSSTIPMVIGIVAAVIVGFESGDRMSGGLEEHIGGSMVLGVVNSSFLQAILAGITWYLIGAAMVGLVQAFGRSMRK